MTSADTRGTRALVPLVVVSFVVVLVAVGQARGFWLANAHNGLMALAFALVGGYVLLQRPGHREGILFLANGAVSAVLFAGRQVGHAPDSPADRWWGWLGVWPVALAIALTTLAVICFPEGRLPSPRWRPVVGAVVGVAVVCAVLSAAWPVEYDATAVTTPHPFNSDTPTVPRTLWSALAHPAYLVFQVIWVVAIVLRWRGASSSVRRQLAWVLCAAAVSVVALLVGLAGWGSPRAGLLAACLVPVAAGLAIVHGQHTTAYAALSWMSRPGEHDADLPTSLARAAAEALAAPSATLWIDDGGQRFHAVGVWPDTDRAIDPVALPDLWASRGHQLRTVVRDGMTTGLITVDRATALSLSESRLFDDLASQASLVVDHLNLADVVAGQRLAGHLDSLSPREGEVLDLMARGLSNVAIAEELHLSIKTVEPLVSTIFTKLGLHRDAGSNRRVLAVLAYLRT